MKLSEYGTLVSTQTYFVDPDKSIAAMTYNNDISDVDLSLEKSNNPNFYYLGEMKHHGRNKYINCNIIPENLSKALEIRNHSNPDKALSLTMRRAPKDNIINGRYEVSLPLELPDHSKILYTFEVAAENICTLFENDIARVLSVDSDDNLKLEYEILIFGNTAFTYNISSVPFSIDSYTILSKDGNMINTSYTGMFNIPNCPDKNLFYPQAVIYFENGIQKATIELEYDNMGILMDGSDHNSFDVTKQVYKIDPRKKNDLLDFIENAEPKLMLELDMDDDKEE